MRHAGSTRRSHRPMQVVEHPLQLQEQRIWHEFDSTRRFQHHHASVANSKAVRLDKFRPSNSDILSRIQVGLGDVLPVMHEG